MDFTTYAGDSKTRDAVERCFQRISEAACKLGPYLDTLCPTIDWKGARGIGNPLRHRYDQISAADLWDGIVNDVPGLYRWAPRFETTFAVLASTATQWPRMWVSD
jgi:uncharacterized protein with HEPN domain